MKPAFTLIVAFYPLCFKGIVKSLPPPFLCSASNRCYNRSMNRYITLLLLALVACQRVPPLIPEITATLAPSSTPVPMTASPTPTATLLPTSTASPPATPPPTPTLTPPPRGILAAKEASCASPCLAAADVHVFPNPVYVGDVLTFDIDPRLPPDGAGVYTLTLTLPDAETLSAPVLAQGLDGQAQARFYWAWDVQSVTTTLSLSISLAIPPEVDDPDLADNTLLFSLPVYTTTALLPPEPWAAWAVTETTGFRLHYLIHTAAERDLLAIVADAQAAYTEITHHLAADADEVVEIYLLDRVIGQGGYASSGWVAVSYVDRMYAPISLGMVLRHELVHRLDKAIQCQGAPTLMREGLAVYIPGGHYRPEPLARKVAALVDSAHYITVEALLDNFYALQHEVSYAEAGALMGYLVDVYGWDGLETLCQTATTTAGADAARFDAALKAIGIADVAQLEMAWRASLSNEAAWDLALVDTDVRLMDTMRAYQMRYDLGAHFLEGVLFDVVEAEDAGLVADFARRPRTPEALALELLLVQAQAALRAEDVATVTALLEAVDVILETGYFTAPPAADALAITDAALALGYEPFRLVPQSEGYEVHALDWADWPTPHILMATPSEDGWQVALLRFAN